MFMPDAEWQAAFDQATPAQQKEFMRRRRICQWIALPIQIAFVIGLIAVNFLR